MRVASNVSRYALAVLLLSIVALTGCYSSNNGPDRFQLSGKVTFDGKPIPLGNMLFTPDRAKGNTGPGAMAEIKDGEYRTPDGSGTIGGPMKVEIVGWDGVPYTMHGETIESGRELFKSYKAEVDVPKQDAELDFDIPKSSK
ncbi:hypothetical protein ACYFX5_04980 [Bremerella sp. T1]|uniref:hypothetical protein n=1 Tax=Bremerella sp. TYQ1 TaxID=3119568 RepID=UPI001CCEF437|nr:hypothetical protein [Bremerella volcania]UBM37616.1 hypothetical protein LA756_06935 [Bremerella volcania]